MKLGESFRNMLDRWGRSKNKTRQTKHAGGPDKWAKQGDVRSNMLLRGMVLNQSINLLKCDKSVTYHHTFL